MRPPPPTSAPCPRPRPRPTPTLAASSLKHLPSIKELKASVEAHEDYKKYDPKHDVGQPWQSLEHPEVEASEAGLTSHAYDRFVAFSPTVRLRGGAGRAGRGAAPSHPGCAALAAERVLAHACGYRAPACPCRLTLQPLTVAPPHLFPSLRSDVL